MVKLCLIGAFGALGALVRYGITATLAHWLGTGFAYGTLVVNVFGSFALAYLMTLTLQNPELPDFWRPAVATGFCGALTTYSTFSYDTVRYALGGGLDRALLNGALNGVLGLGAAWLGIVWARAEGVV